MQAEFNFWNQILIKSYIFSKFSKIKIKEEPTWEHWEISCAHAAPTTFDFSCRFFALDPFNFAFSAASITEWPRKKSPQLLTKQKKKRYKLW